MNITKAQRCGDDQLLMLESAGQDGVNEGTIWCIHASIDGEPFLGTHQRSLDRPKSVISRAKVKEKVQAILMAAVDPPGYTPMPRPGFVVQMANDSEGVSACLEHGHIA